MKTISKLLSSSLMVVITLSLLLFARYDNWKPIEMLRLKYYDELIGTLEPVKNDDIVLVNIGEQSLQENGQWPWPRQDMGELIRDLNASGAKSIALVLFFPEEDRMGGDQDLADAIKAGNNVLMAQTAGQIGETAGKQQKLAVIGGDPKPFVFTWPKMIRSIDILEESAAATGMAIVRPEVDSVVRRAPLIVRVGDTIYPNVTMQALGVATGKNTIQIKMGPAGIDKIRVQGIKPMTTDANGRIWMTWNNQFDSIEASDTASFDRVYDKHVIVGLDAAGLTTMISTPAGLKQPHEIQANLLATAIDNRNIYEPATSILIELAIILGVGIMLMIAVPLMQYIFPAILAFGSMGGVIYYSLDSFKTGMLIDASYPVLAIFLIFSHLVYNKFIREAAQRRLISKQFGTYLSPDMVKQLQKNPDLLKLGGETRDLSIMFTDVRGFTAISEHYGKDVQGLTAIMNRYMTAMTAKILENKGTLDKYIGDAQMAFWNAPLDNPSHAKDAVKTALEMLGSLDAFNKEVSAEGVPPFGMGLGINTGSVVVGNMGSDQRFDYTCLGDSVNLASRLEGQSKPYAVAMVIGPNTYEQVKDEYLCLLLDLIAVKGKKEGSYIYTVINADDSQKKLWLEDKSAHDHMMDDYFAQRFKEAAKQCQSLKGRFGGQMDGFYDMWAERCVEMSKSKPGPGWDKVYRATSK